MFMSRDSVAAGDDVESHDQVVEVDSRRLLAVFLSSVVSDGYLPGIAGGHATWVVRAGRGGRPLGVIAQEGERPELLTDIGIQVVAIGPLIHFEYRAQKDPAIVLADLRQKPR